MKAVTSPARSDEAPATSGVGGWLLVLCLMLTIVGPIISVWIVATEFDASAPSFAASRIARWATIASIALTTGSVIVGIRAGLALWTIRPHAVRLAKASLAFALVVDVSTTTISTLLLGTSASATDLFYDVLQNLAPGLAFFTLCLGYLNRSRRVEATYRPD